MDILFAWEKPTNAAKLRPIYQVFYRIFVDFTIVLLDFMAQIGKT